MSETHEAGGVAYRKVDEGYFEKRGFQRYAGVWSLWALGVGAVISGHFSGWNFGFATGGWGGMLVAGIIIAIMYLGLVFCIAEMSPALPHTGAAYSFARTSMGPWGGFITGLFENVEYVLTPAVIVTFIVGLREQHLRHRRGLLAGDLGGHFTSSSWRSTSSAWRCATGDADRHAALAGGAGGLLDQRHPAHGLQPLGAQHRRPDGGVSCRKATGRWFPFGFTGVLATLPFAVWLFLAIEQVPLAAEESVDPKRDMPKGIMLGMRRWSSRPS